jgi:hypothetical protein
VIVESLDAFLQARALLFADLDLPPGDVDDLRKCRWSGDHGVVWWEDGDGRRCDASTTSQFLVKDGLSIFRDQGRHVWLVFTSDREDYDFAF